MNTSTVLGLFVVRLGFNFCSKFKGEWYVSNDMIGDYVLWNVLAKNVSDILKKEYTPLKKNDFDKGVGLTGQNKNYWKLVNCSALIV